MMKNITRIVTLSIVVFISIIYGCKQGFKEDIKLYTKVGNSDTVSVISEYDIKVSNEGINQNVKLNLLSDSIINYRNFLIVEEDPYTFTRYIVKSNNNKVLLNKFILLNDTCYKPLDSLIRMTKPNERNFCFVYSTLDTIVDSIFYEKIHFFKSYAIGETYISGHIYDSNFVPIKEWYIEGYGKSFVSNRVIP